MALRADGTGGALHATAGQAGRFVTCGALSPADVTKVPLSGKFVACGVRGALDVTNVPLPNFAASQTTKHRSAAT
jgi:hypothetical protein